MSEIKGATEIQRVLLQELGLVSTLVFVHLTPSSSSQLPPGWHRWPCSKQGAGGYPCQVGEVPSTTLHYAYCWEAGWETCRSKKG